MKGVPNEAAIGDEARYCSQLVRAVDEHRWLALQFAPLAVRARRLALLALHAEVARVPAAVSEAPLGEIRLQWWREAVAEIVDGGVVRAHPVVSYARAVSAVTASNRAAVDAAIDARAHLLYREPLGDLDDVFAWLDAAEGYLATAHAPADEPVGEIFRRAESAFALAGAGEGMAVALSGVPAAGRTEATQAAIRAAMVPARAAYRMLDDERAAELVHLALVERRLAGPASPVRALGDRFALAGAVLFKRL